MAHLKCLDPSRFASEETLPLGLEGLLIGRDASCDLVLPDDAVSRRHAEIRMVEGRWRIRDLGSTNGTSVNHLAVGEALLASGDRIRIGRSVFLFEDVRPPVLDELPVPRKAPRRPGAARAILAGSLLALGLLGGFAAAWKLHGRSRAGLPQPLPPAPRPPQIQAEPVRAAAPEPGKREPGCDLTIHVTGQYDHSFDSPDQNWSLEEDLELEAKGIPLKAEGGIYRGRRSTANASDEVECVLEGSRVARLRWRASRRMIRSMSDGRKVPAREETWTFEVENLQGATGNRGALACRWRAGAGPLPRLAHSVTFYPQGATVALEKAIWTAGGEGGKGGDAAEIRVTLWR